MYKIIFPAAGLVSPDVVNLLPSLWANIRGDDGDISFLEYKAQIQFLLVKILLITLKK